MLNRRHFIHATAGLACTPLFARALSAEAARAKDTIVVAIALAGGNDGLNTVIPLKQYGAYYTLRTPAQPPPGEELAYAQADLAPLAFDSNYRTPPAQATEFAFAPSMGTMRSLYGLGNLAVVAGMGLPLAETNSLSHENGWLDWMTGQINVDLTNLPHGWMGLTLDEGHYGLLGPSASFYGKEQILVGKKRDGLTLGAIDYYNLSLSETDNYIQLEEAFAAELSASQTGAAAFDQSVAYAAVSSAGAMQTLAQAFPASDYPAPMSALDNTLKDIARLILGGSGMRGFMTALGSFDTHGQQNLNNYHPILLSQLSYAMSNFWQYMKSKGASRNLVIMTFSDFGRRPAANLDFGTDHGAASVGFVLGDQVRGGVYGKYPSLTKFDPNGNLAVKVDFRNVLSDIINAMGGNPQTVLGENYPKLGFI